MKTEELRALENQDQNVLVIENQRLREAFKELYQVMLNAHFLRYSSK